MTGQGQSDPPGTQVTIGGHAATLQVPINVPAAPTQTSVGVVIPAMNESENIGWVLSSMPRWVQEVILVDGHSTDGTVEVAKHAWPDLVVVQQHGKGKGSALREGFASADSDILVMIDADGSMDPGEIDRYVDPLDKDECDVVKGSRWLDGGGSLDITPVRKLGNRALLALVNTLFRSSFTELCYGFMALKRSCLGCLRLAGNGFEIETEIVVNALRAGLRVQEVPSLEAPRRHGESNLHPVRDGLRILRTVGGALLREPVPDPAALGPVRPPAVEPGGQDAGGEGSEHSQDLAEVPK